MLRLPSRLELGPYTLHLDVLAARWQRRRGRQLGRTLLLLAALGVSGVLLSSYARGTGTVVVPEHDVSVRLTLDGTSIPHTGVTLPSGTYTLRVEQAGSFPVEQTIQVTRGQTTTVTLSLLRPIPLVQPLPPPSAESMWAQVSPDVSGGWRIAAAQPSVEDATRARPGWGPSVPTEERILFHLDPDGLAPLSVLETYPVADEVMGANNARFWAVWEAERNAAQSDVVGTLTISTPTGTRTLSTTVALAGLWWSPGGHVLLAAFPHDGGVDLTLLDPRHPQIPTAPLITAPGVVQSVQWHPGGQAAVVITVPETPVVAQNIPNRALPTDVPAPNTETLARRSAVLVRLSQSDAPQAVRLRPPPTQGAGLVPLAWSTNELWWVADTGLGLALDRVNMASGEVERVGRLPDTLAALTVLPNDSVRIVRTTPDQQFVIERWPQGEALFTLPDATATGLVGGTWRGNDLLLASDRQLWYVQFQPEALQ